jgi:hypothetical protein
MVCSQSYRICLEGVCTRLCSAMQITGILRVVGEHTVWYNVWLANNSSAGNCASSSSRRNRSALCYSPDRHKLIGSASTTSFARHLVCVKNMQIWSSCAASVAACLDVLALRTKIQSSRRSWGMWTRAHCMCHTTSSLSQLLSVVYSIMYCVRNTREIRIKIYISSPLWAASR